MARRPISDIARSASLSSSQDAQARALNGIWAVLLTAFIIAALYIGRDVLIPLALSALLTFLLAPFVTRLERWIGKIPAVLVTVLLIILGTFGAGWALTSQAVDLANQLPGYKENIRAKLQSVHLPEQGPFTRLSEAYADLKKDFPGQSTAPATPSESTPASDPEPMPVQVINSSSHSSIQLARTWAMPLLGPIGTAGLVLLLIAFMLIKREDLRARFIRLIGQGRISATTSAMDDAGTRIRKYLFMQLVVNVTYGLPLAVGLYFIGVPNALLWGICATVLRFIPYIGPWIAAAFPIVLSLAVAPSWTAPLLTIGLFVVLELISNNVLEPWLYGSSTGVSSVALIIAAVFWTWMWGPIGLVLTTPFTVCLVVMGRHIPQLSFLSVVLSEEEALTPAEDLYHRILKAGEHDEHEIVDAYLKSHSLHAFYDEVLLAVVASAELDHREGHLSSDQHQRVMDHVAEMIEDLRESYQPPEELLTGETSPHEPAIDCIPARAQRDVLACAMLVHILEHRGLKATAHPLQADRATRNIVSDEPSSAVCVIACVPSKPSHARIWCERFHRRYPERPLAVALPGHGGDFQEAQQLLRNAGATGILVNLGETADWCEVLVGDRSAEAEPGKTALIPETDVPAP